MSFQITKYSLWYLAVVVAVGSVLLSAVDNVPTWAAVVALAGLAVSKLIGEFQGRADERARVEKKDEA